MVPVNRCGSCRTTPKLRRRSFEIELANVDAADADAAALNLIEAQQQAGKGGLACAGVSHHGDGLAGLDAKAHIAQNPVLVLVGEPDAGRIRWRRAPAEKPLARSRRRECWTGVSSSLKTRSEAAMADCRMLYFSLRS